MLLHARLAIRGYRTPYFDREYVYDRIINNRRRDCADASNPRYRRRPDGRAAARQQRPERELRGSGLNKKAPDLFKRSGAEAGVPGLEPRTRESESPVLPITPYPTVPSSSSGRRSTLAHRMARSKPRGVSILVLLRRALLNQRDTRPPSSGATQPTGYASSFVGRYSTNGSGTPSRSRFSAAATFAPAPAATISCCGPGAVESPAA